VSDGIAFERHGIPSAVVCTSAFERTGRALAKAEGLPRYPFIAGQHPVAILTPTEARAWAERVWEDVESLLARGALATPEPG
jgi:hypothetical protein